MKTYKVIVYWTTKKNTLKMFGPRTWCMKKPFGYQVVHQGYLLTSCQWQLKYGYIDIVANRILVVKMTSLVFKY